MILEHLFKKTDFKEYVKSIKIPDHMLTQIATSIDWKNDSYLNDCVKNSRKLSPLCFDNSYAQAEKRKLVFRVISYLCRNSYSCDDIFDNLYSKTNSKSKQKASDFKKEYRNEFLLRQKYITAFEEIHDESGELSGLFDFIEGIAEFPEYSDGKYDISKVQNAVEFLNDTEGFKGKKLKGKKLSYTNLGVSLRDKKLALLDKRLDDGGIMAYWLTQRYEYLSNANLKKAGDLLCDAYNSVYHKQIKEFRDDKKRKYNRERYTPKKKKALSAKEKREKIIKMKAEGYTQKQTAERLEVSISTVERNWNK